MPINTANLKKGLKETGKVLGIGAAGGTIGAGLGGLEGLNYNMGGTRFTNYKPVKDKKKRKENLKTFMIGYGALGALATPGLYLYGKSLSKAFDRAEHRRSGYHNYGGYQANAKRSAESFKDVLKEHGVNLKDIKTKEQFNKAYRKLAKEWHPDINKTPGAEEKFKKINTAVEALRNSEWFEKLALLLKFNMEKTAGFLGGTALGYLGGLAGGSFAGKGLGMLHKTHPEIPEIRKQIDEHRKAVSDIKEDWLKRLPHKEDIENMLGEHDTSNMTVGEMQKLINDYVNKNMTKQASLKSTLIGAGLTGIPLGIAMGRVTYKSEKRDRTDLDYQKKELEKAINERGFHEKLLKKYKGNIPDEFIEEHYNPGIFSNHEEPQYVHDSIKAYSEKHGIDVNKLKVEDYNKIGKKMWQGELDYDVPPNNILKKARNKGGTAMNKVAEYKEIIEKTAKAKNKSEAVAVGAGAGAGLGSMLYDAGQSAKHTAKVEGKNGIKAGLKSMAEKAGGKSPLAKNLLLQHGPKAALSGALATGIVMARNAHKDKMKKRLSQEGDAFSKKASYKQGIEKLAFSGFNKRRKLRKMMQQLENAIPSMMA